MLTWSHFRFIITNLRRVSAAWQFWYISWPVQLSYSFSSFFKLPTFTTPHLHCCHFYSQKIEIIKMSKKLSLSYPPKLIPCGYCTFHALLGRKSHSPSIIREHCFGSSPPAPVQHPFFSSIKKVSINE